MNRLNVIQFMNPVWHKQLTEFLDDHPYMFRLLPIVALDEYPAGFNKNPQEKDPDAPRNVFETLLYGISHSNVDNAEGKALFNKIAGFLRSLPKIHKDTVIPVEMTPRKRRTINDLINLLLDNDTEPQNMAYSQWQLVYPIDGLGDSVFDLLHLLYADVDDETVIPYTEPYFVRGMEMMYGVEQPTIEELKEVTKTWRNKKVGTMFVTQYAHYSKYVDDPELREKQRQRENSD